MAVSVGSSTIILDGLKFLVDAGSTRNYLLSNVEVLVVAGGGGGGANHAGGGGAGGLVYSNSYRVTPGIGITVTVGNGGSRSTSHTSGPIGGSGGNSVFGSIIAIGGGGGGNRRDGGTAGLEFGANGGSGGGGGGQGTNDTPTSTGGTGTQGQGFAGGTASYHAGAGGGGAGGPGNTTYNSLGGSTATCFPGDGGPGLCFNISGTPKYYAGGGGGGGFIGGPFAGKGGLGGGGDGQINGTQRVNGEPNTGGGGGGANGGGNTNGGAGGSGVVIVRYPGPQKATGGNTITNVNGYTIHTFTSSGTFTPLSAPTNGGTIYGFQDLVGSNYTAVASGSPTYSSANGGTANFDGVDDFYIFNNTENGFGLCNNRAATGTMGIWANITRRSGNFQQLAGFRNDTSFDFFFLLLDTGGATVNTEARFRTSAGIWDINVPYNFFGSWVYITFVANVNRTDLYFNSVLAGSNTSVTGNFGSNSGQFRIGRSPASAYQTQGNIAIVQFYDRALSQTEITQNYNAQRRRFGL